MPVNLFLLKLAMLAFWSAWFALVFCGNLCAGLKALRLLPAGWRYASSNFHVISQAIARYHLPHPLAIFLFYGVVVWQLLAASFFLVALLASVHGLLLDINAINAAFIVAIVHWMALLLADELFEQHEKAKSHALSLMLQLATLLCIHLLPP